uniref:Transposase n=1 Tax=Peronospora matthiolae TaxID=2874970 RepID=A0AAV1V2K4_9STRA
MNELSKHLVPFQKSNRRVVWPLTKPPTSCCCHATHSRAQYDNYLFLSRHFDMEDRIDSSLDRNPSRHVRYLGFSRVAKLLNIMGTTALQTNEFWRSGFHCRRSNVVNVLNQCTC